jgi:hypothetical protein
MNLRLRKSVRDALRRWISIVLLAAGGGLLLAAAARTLRAEQPPDEPAFFRPSGSSTAQRQRQRAAYFASKLGLGFGVPDRARQQAVEAMHVMERKQQIGAPAQPQPLGRIGCPSLAVHWPKTNPQ